MYITKGRSPARARRLDPGTLNLYCDAVLRRVCLGAVTVTRSVAAPAAGTDSMSEGFQVFDIILFAMVAAFILLRLRGVLGRRTGH